MYGARQDAGECGVAAASPQRREGKMTAPGELAVVGMMAALSLPESTFGKYEPRVVAGVYAMGYWMRHIATEAEWQATSNMARDVKQVLGALGDTLGNALDER